VEEPVLALCEPGPCGDNAECIINDSGEDCRCNPGFSGNPYQVTGEILLVTLTGAK
jgi:hypothetical protein